LRLDKLLSSTLYGIAYVLSLLRLPFAVLPYCFKLFGAIVLKKHYQVSDYAVAVEALRVLGEMINWGIGVLVLDQLGSTVPMIRILCYVSIVAETLRLFTEKGQMIFSVIWQLLPHRRVANYLHQKLIRGESDPRSSGWLIRYCGYYRLDDEQRIEYVLNTLRSYAAASPQTSNKLAYLTTLRIVPSSHGMRGGHVRDVARGEVFIHRQWTADPWLLIGQALRRTPWFFDPRYLRRPFYYRTESNRLATLFVLSHARYCPPYALYQFGHEVKAARYDFLYRILRWIHFDVEPKIQADGTFPFDHGVSWLKKILFGDQPGKQTPLWQDREVIADVRRRTADGEKLLALDIATQYTYPLKYVEEVLLGQINCM
jgi:hypothetical protein